MYAVISLMAKRNPCRVLNYKVLANQIVTVSFRNLLQVFLKSQVLLPYCTLLTARNCYRGTVVNVMIPRQQLTTGTLHFTPLLYVCLRTLR